MVTLISLARVTRSNLNYPVSSMLMKLAYYLLRCPESNCKTAAAAHAQNRCVVARHARESLGKAADGVMARGGMAPPLACDAATALGRPLLMPSPFWPQNHRRAQTQTPAPMPSCFLMRTLTPHAPRSQHRCR
jgi:hypothetical protein